MNECFNCMYMHPDWDVNGNVIRPEYCHYVGPDEWAPCAEEEYEEDAYDVSYAYDSMNDWLIDQAIADEDYRSSVEYYGEPYDYQEF